MHSVFRNLHKYPPLSLQDLAAPATPLWVVVYDDVGAGRHAVHEALLLYKAVHGVVHVCHWGLYQGVFLAKKEYLDIESLKVYTDYLREKKQRINIIKYKLNNKHKPGFEPTPLRLACLYCE